MGSLSTLERDIANRHRTLQGIRTAGVAFAWAAGVVLAASIAARCAAVRPGLAVSTGTLIAVGLAAAAGCVVGRARKLSLPRLLLSVDLALGTGERLSSLYELRSHGAAPVLQRRIEERLAQKPLAWRRVLRAGRAEILAWAAGGVALTVALALSVAVAPLAAPVFPHVQTAASGGMPQTTRASAARPAATSSEPAVGTAADRVVPGQGVVAEPLVDTLAELLPTPPSHALLGPTAGALEDRRRLSSGSGEGLYDLLKQISRRGQDTASQDFGLTEREGEALRDLAEDLPDSDLREALFAILGGETGDAVKDRVAEAQELLGSQNPTRTEGDETESGGAGEPSDDAQQGTSETDSAVSPGTPSDDSRSTGGDESGTGATPEAPGTESAPSPPADVDDGGRVGRSAGDGSPSPDASGLVPADLLSEWGASGDVRGFMTKGLPLEPPAAGESLSSNALAVDFEILRSLLETRALTPALQDLVRTYFETITRGEP